MSRSSPGVMPGLQCDQRTAVDLSIGGAQRYFIDGDQPAIFADAATEPRQDIDLRLKRALRRDAGGPPRSPPPSRR